MSHLFFYIFYGKFERRDSTISHIGFILLALSINSEQSIDSLIFYIIQYSITNLNTFLILLALGYIIKNTIQTGAPTAKATNRATNDQNYYSPLGQTGSKSDLKYISELMGQFFANPLLSISLTICLFSMAGKRVPASDRLWRLVILILCWKFLKL